MPSKITQLPETSLRIGKAGITENVVKQTIGLLKKKKIIKIKFLPTAVKSDKKALVSDLAQRAHARVVHMVGFTAIIEKIK